MRIRAIGMSLIVLLSASGLTRAQSTADRVPVIAELFTYWDHQGWKDPFSAQQYTVRQQHCGL